ncbi:MAG TPA: gamma carbonic anhydrase family protein [Gemmatimonadota bacterium]|nr:gamma carbonic anhydrase family protein [Gemmatimonadota bacterium]
MNPDDLTTARQPTIADDAWVAPGAVVVGDVTLASRASVWYGCVLRGDIAPIRVGARTNVQDLTMVHVDTDQPCIIGADVGIGHRAIIHGCTIADGCLIGMGAIVLSHAVIGAGSVIGAGAVVREGTEVPPGSLVVGVPGRVIRDVDDELRARTAMTVDHYLALSTAHRDGRWGRGAGG